MNGPIFHTFGSAYRSLVTTVKEWGVESAPRNKPVVEMRWPHMWHIAHPEFWVLKIPGRKLNPFFALAEVVWMWSGKGGAEFISFYNKSIIQFLDDGMPYFHGSYGKRVRKAGYDESPLRPIPSVRTVPGPQGSISVTVDQLQHVISKIQRDPDTRQAVVSLWDPVKDNLVQSADHPCNNLLYFLKRDGKLNMTVVRRSNDLILGVPYNMCQFTHLQALMAGSLGLQMGHYSVMANNLHFYTEMYPDILKLVQDWAHAHSRDVMDLNHSVFIDPMDTWNLDGLDKFMRDSWEPFEKKSRRSIDQLLDGDVMDLEPFYGLQVVLMENKLSESGLPKYWANLFRMLMLYHASKGMAWKVCGSIIRDLPESWQWLITDWWIHSKKHSRLITPGMRAAYGEAYAT
jgi:thymidylate synthase